MTLGLLQCSSALAQAPTAAPPAPELKLSVVVAPLYPPGAAAKAWTDALNEGAKGTFTVKFYPGASLANHDATQEFKALQSNAIDIAVGSALRWSDAFPPLGVFSLPWMAPSNRELTAVVADPAVQTQLAAKLDEAGVSLVAIATLRHRDLSTQSREIGAPADLKNLRVRVPGPALVTDTYIALGAMPSGLKLEDARKAFEEGTLDGQDNSAAALVMARAWATGAHRVVQWNAFANVMVFAVRKTLWQAWPETTRAMVRAAALKAIDAAQATERERAAHDDLARNGIAVTRLTPAGFAAFRAQVDPVYATWTPKIGAELVDAVRKAAASAPEASDRPAPHSPADPAK